MKTLRFGAAQSDGIFSFAVSADVPGITAKLEAGEPYRVYIPSPSGVLVFCLVPGAAGEEELNSVAVRAILDHVKRGIDQ